MDRSKLAKRPTKGKGHPPPGDFIALGKSKSGSEPDLARISSSSSSSTSNQPKKLLAFGKRDSPTPPLGSSLAAKKPKLTPQTFTPLGRPEGRSSPALLSTQHEEIGIDCDPADLLDCILEAEESGDDERIEGLLCGAVRTLRLNRSKPDQAIYLTLMYLAKNKPSVFYSEIVCDAFCSLLRKDVTAGFKAKGNPTVPVLCANILYTAYQDEENWPDSMVKVYVEDCLGDRIWIDRADCKAFVENIETAFNTKLPPKSTNAAIELLQSLEQHRPSPSRTTDDEDKSMDSSESDSRLPPSLEAQEHAIFPRYIYQMESTEAYVLDIVHDQVQRRTSLDSGSRNFLKLLTSTCGYGEVRLMAASRFEMWLQNPKLQKTSQDLLMAVCMNCNQHNQTDVEAMGQLVKMRLKTKPLVMHYLACVRELLGLHPKNLKTLMTQTIYNELSTSRNPNNMSVIGEMFKHSPETSAETLAEIFQDLLTNRDDYLRALMALFREIVRSLRHDINFAAFCLGLMSERNDAKFKDLDSPLKDRYVSAVSSMIALSQLLTITPTVREATSAHVRGDQKDINILWNFRKQLAVIQRDAVWWLHTVVPDLIDTRKGEYSHYLKKVLFMETAEHYHKVDNWPQESERNMMLRLCAEAPVLEDTLMRVLVMGLARELPVNPADALELADNLVRRAAALYLDGHDVLVVERLEMMDAILNLSAYHHPGNIALPKGYAAPSLSISNQYWKAWIMLLVLSAFNPSTFGFSAWENYPTLKFLMEMIMTNNYQFPPQTVTTDEKKIEKIKNKEKQIAELEKQQVLEFESHLAAATSKATITEHNSLLISQLTGMDPNGIARKPPSSVIEILKHLNQSLQLGQMLCRSRSPDFLLDIIQRQGTSQSMPWLAELVESSEGSLDMLPVQCLCEFLLHDTVEIDLTEDERKVDKSKRKQKIKKQQQLLGRLQRLLHEEQQNSRAVIEVLEYFLQRLTNQQTSSRAQAFKGLSLVLSKSQIAESEMETNDNCLIPEHAWLLEQLPTIPLFEAVKEKTCSALRKTCLIETSARAVSAYVLFLSKYTQSHQLHDLDSLALDMAGLIVERTTIISHVLPSSSNPTALQERVLAALINMFANYVKRAKAPQNEGYNWSDTQDQIILQWSSGDSATMHVLVVHAMIILLIYGNPSVPSEFVMLFDTWFPEDNNQPSAYLVDTSEEALLLPDWLKLRMIRTRIPVLVDAALADLEPSQLLLFMQSFGIPVESMSKLLLSLDKATKSNRSTVEESVMDKNFMAQLVKAQWKRGATGGMEFFNILDDDSDKFDEEDEDVDMKDAEHKRPPTAVSVMNADIIIPHGNHGMQEVIMKLFGLKEHTPKAQRQQLHWSLLKGITKDIMLTNVFIQSLLELLRSLSINKLISGLVAYPNFTCSLLRTIFSKKDICDKVSQQLWVVSEMLLQSCPKESLVHSVIKQYVDSIPGNHDELSSDKKIKEFWHSVQNPDSAGSIGLETKEQQKLEVFIEKSMRRSLAKNLVEEAARSTSSLILNNSALPTSTAGLFIDWLELLDPEIVSVCPEVQQQLIFAKKSATSGSSRTKTCQPYLLSLLTHQTSWDTLHRCIDQLFGEHADVKQYDPTNVLDFAWACVYIPKIWQGVETKTAKVHSSRTILSLTKSEIIHLVQYVIEEACNLQDSENNMDIINRRVELLKTCCLGQPGLMHAVADYVENCIKENSSTTELYLHLLRQLYLQEPDVIFWLESSSIVHKLLRDGQTVAQSSSQFDILSHQLMSAIASTEAGKKGENKLYDVNIACRKLVMMHPTLMLRQLPMIGGLLKGRVHFTIVEFQNRNHLLVFTHILGMLELMQPYIFQREHSKALDDTLESYFDLIASHGLCQRQLVPLVNKLVIFLQNFIESSPQRASSILKRHSELLKQVGEVYPDMAAIRSLLATLSLPTLEESSDMTSTPPRPSSPYTVEQLTPFLKKISKGQRLESILEVLDDLDKTSRRKIDVLQHFVSDLKRLMHSASEMCRNTTYHLIMRYMRHRPSVAENFVPDYLQCFESHDEGVVDSALKNLPEITLLCHEKAGEILQKAFMVGINMKVDTTSYINDTMHLLNLESLQDLAV